MRSRATRMPLTVSQARCKRVATTMQAVGGFVGDLVERAQHAYNGFLLWQSGTVSLRTALDAAHAGRAAWRPVIEGITCGANRQQLDRHEPANGAASGERPLTGTLQPALTTVYDVFNTQVIPIITNLAATVCRCWAARHKSLVDFHQCSSRPGSCWNAFTTLLLPVLSDVAVWLRDNSRRRCRRWPTSSPKTCSRRSARSTTLRTQT